MKNEIVCSSRLLKTIFDKCFALVLCVILSPLFLCIALLSKINGLFVCKDKGPVFFSIERISKGKVIRLIKFRTVKIEKIEEMLIKQGRIDDIKTLEHNNANLTWLGKYLRDYYLDELPQMFNILKGDMSVVGPRPYPLSMYKAEISKGIFRKKIIQAGLTGLVQINKTKIKSKEEEIAFDYEYITKAQTLSSLNLFLLDIKIILKSIVFILKGQGL